MRRNVVITAWIILMVSTGVVLFQETTRAFGGTPRWSGRWVTTWAGATQAFPVNCCMGSQPPPPEFRDAYIHGILQDQTIRVVVQSTLSGNRVRVRLSNQFGREPLKVESARIARIGFGMSKWKDPVFSWGYDPSPESERELFFEGNSSVVIPPGGVVRSDPVAFETGDRGSMQISFYIPDKTGPATLVGQADRASVLRGNATALNSQQQASGMILRGAYFLAAVEVYSFKDSRAVLIIDDDGILRHGWSDRIALLKDDLLANGGSNRFAILDASVPYCYMTAVCTTPILQRIEDVRRNRPGVKWVVLSAGYLDLGFATDRRFAPGTTPALIADAVIRAQKAVVDVVHEAGMKIYGVTYPRVPSPRMPYPWMDNRGFNEDFETTRATVNSWIRSSGTFDAVDDLDGTPADARLVPSVF